VSQGFLSRFQFGAAGMRRLFNLWPPFRAAGITESGAKHESVFRVEIVDATGNTVADVAKTLHIRKKKK
jgi:hypothetical protein